MVLQWLQGLALARSIPCANRLRMVCLQLAGGHTECRVPGALSGGEGGATGTRPGGSRSGNSSTTDQ